MAWLRMTMRTTEDLELAGIIKQMTDDINQKYPLDRDPLRTNCAVGDDMKDLRLEVSVVQSELQLLKRQLPDNRVQSSEDIAAKIVDRLSAKVVSSFEREISTFASKYEALHQKVELQMQDHVTHKDVATTFAKLISDIKGTVDAQGEVFCAQANAYASMTCVQQLAASLEQERKARAESENQIHKSISDLFESVKFIESDFTAREVEAYEAKRQFSEARSKLLALRERSTTRRDLRDVVGELDGTSSTLAYSLQNCTTSTVRDWEEIDRRISAHEQKLDTLASQLQKTLEAFNLDGTVRRERIQETVAEISQQTAADTTALLREIAFGPETAVRCSVSSPGSPKAVSRQSDFGNSVGTPCPVSTTPWQQGDSQPQPVSGQPVVDAEGGGQLPDQPQEDPPLSVCWSTGSSPCVSGDRACEHFILQSSIAPVMSATVRTASPMMRASPSRCKLTCTSPARSGRGSPAAPSVANQEFTMSVECRDVHQNGTPVPGGDGQHRLRSSPSPLLERARPEVEEICLQTPRISRVPGTRTGGIRPGVSARRPTNPRAAACQRAESPGVCARLSPQRAESPSTCSTRPSSQTAGSVRSALQSSSPRTNPGGTRKMIAGVSPRVITKLSAGTSGISSPPLPLESGSFVPSAFDKHSGQMWRATAR